MNKPFQFSAANQAKISKLLKKYPANHSKSAVMGILDLAQNQNDGWLSQATIEAVAGILNMPVIKVQEVATFYSMYRLKPVGKTIIQVCTTTPCWLRGSDALMKTCERKLGLHCGETKNDVSLFEVQCLGACVNAPIVQINDAYVEDLDPQSLEDILEDVLEGKAAPKGSVIGRVSSEPHSSVPSNLQKATSIVKISKSRSTPSLGAKL